MLLRFGSAAFILSTLIATGCSTTVTADDTGPDATITVINSETFGITDIYIDPVGTTTFSDNLLVGGDILEPGEQITFDLDCGNYDVELIDEADGDCIVRNTDTCLNDAVIEIDDQFCSFTSKKTGQSVKVPRVVNNPASKRVLTHK